MESSVTWWMGSVDGFGRLGQYLPAGVTFSSAGGGAVSKSVYEDLDYDDADGMASKASLVWLLERTLADRSIEYAEAAKQFGISTDELADLLRGRFRDIAPEQLLGYLRLIGYNIEVHVVASKESPGSVTLVPPPHLDPVLRR